MTDRLGTGIGARNTHGRHRAALLATTALVGAMWSAAASAQTAPPAPTALPTGGRVSAGQAAIATAGAAMTVTQATQRAAINWDSYNIGASAAVTYVQPNAQAIALNRVTGNDPSQIFGRLSANGQVWLVNPNGILFGRSARVDVAGLVAATANITDQEFMSGTGRFRFDQAGRAGAAIVNEGEITVRDAGIAAFVAPGVRNSGTITANLGTVALAGGNSFTLDLYGDRLVNLAVNDPATQNAVAADGSAVQAGVTNSGRIMADGGRVQVSANVARGVVDSVIRVPGEIVARGVSVDRNGDIVLDGGSAGNIEVAGRIDASGPRRGGRVTITAQRSDSTAGGVVTVTGTIDARGGTDAGGSVAIAGRVLSLGGTINAAGARGGTVTLDASALLLAGEVRADGTAGSGGSIAVTTTDMIAMSGSLLSAASLAGGDGGTVTVTGIGDSAMFTSGAIDVSAAAGTGGTATLAASVITLVDATIDASGAAGGGTIAIGGDGGAGADAVLATRVWVSATSVLHADATDGGDGGTITMWSGERTTFVGTATARGGAAGGDGGLIEVSSRGDVQFAGLADAGAPAGAAGTLLLDPKYIVVDAAATALRSFQLLDPRTGGAFSAITPAVVLANQNVVVVDSGNDVVATNAGAVFLFNGVTGAIISTLTGAGASDQIGDNGVTLLTNGNYVVSSPRFSSARGAVTWGNATAGTTGVVSSTNSLVGSVGNSWVGGSNTSAAIGGVFALTNGNFVVDSPVWINGTLSNAGAVTWGNGSSGITGIVSSSNSLVGTAFDQVGGRGVTVLTNGNYVVRTAIGSRGAVTWGSGTSGVVGTLSSDNSLYGGNFPGFAVGDGGVVALSNGNYVVVTLTTSFSSTFSNEGAVTWANGTTGISGTLSSTNSLIGRPGDRLGSGGVVALSNGNYVIVSPNASFQSAAAAEGAVTWGNGTAGPTGVISTSISLIGSPGSQAGSGGVFALSNGNYVVASPQWRSGTVTALGAATWGNGSTGTTGVISSGNSLIGVKGNSQVGSGGVAALSNGNYVVISPLWGISSSDNVGAVTWGNGSTGTTGVISSANSLVGVNTNDQVGSGGVAALSNGNYVVISPLWGISGLANVGAVTWGNGASGTSGLVGPGGSLTGASDNDRAGSGGVVALANGAYVVVSPLWNNGGSTSAAFGAVTWASGTAATTALIGSSNSLVGGTAGDRIGSGGVVTLSNNAFVVVSPNWQNPIFSASKAGAVTWGSGTAALTGTVSSQNSLMGTTANDQVGSGGVVALANGAYVVSSPLWDNGTIPDAGAVTWRTGTSGSSGFTGFVFSSNSLVGTSANDQVGSGGVFVVGNAGRYAVSSPLWDNGAIVNAGAATLGSSGGVSGPISVATSVTGITANEGMRVVGVTPANAIAIASGATGRTFVLTDIAPPSPIGTLYSDAPSASITIAPTTITAILNTGTAVTLQANSDIVLNSAIVANNPGGNGGALTLQAGRSVILNAGITTDNGNLTIIANDTTAAGVVAANRDPGAAAITMNTGSPITAGSGAVLIEILDGAGRSGTAAASGDISLRGVSGSTVTVLNQGPGLGDIILNGVIATSATGTAITLVTGGDFVNNAGSAALSPSNGGRFLIYLAAPSNRQDSALVAGNFYNMTYPSAPGASFGSRFVYAFQPTLTVTASSHGVTYGDGAPAVSASVDISGIRTGDPQAEAFTGTPGATTLYTAGSSVAGGPYAVTASLGTLTSPIGYGFTLVDGSIAVDPATLTYTAAPASRTYGAANPTLGGSVTGFQLGQTQATATTGTLTFTTAALPGDNVGLYAVTGGGLTANNGNYTFQQATANATAFSITPATLTYNAAPVSRVTGQPNPVLTGSVTGFVLGQSQATATTGTLLFSTTATQNSPAGSYAITGSGLTASNGNYVFVQAPGNATALTVTPLSGFELNQAQDPPQSNPPAGFAGMFGSTIVLGPGGIGGLASIAPAAGGSGGGTAFSCGSDNEAAANALLNASTFAQIQAILQQLQQCN